MRLSRASSAKRTVSEIVDFKFPHFEISCVNEQIMIEREKLIKYNKRYFERHKQMPTTILDFYKFVQLIGKGAFGKVTLAIHKLTGRYVAIKAIDKTYMQDSYSRQKVL
jgi:serine/threonine protein kinase